MKNLFWKLAGVLLAAWSFNAAAAGEISLIKVQSNQQDVVGSTTQAIDDVITVLVANLGYQKQVVAHAKNSSGAWIDLPLSFNRTAANGKEVWTGTFRRDFGQADLEFAMKYLVNGQTYWDNNNSANYHVNAAGIRLFNINVSLNDDNPALNPTITDASGGITRGAGLTLKNLGATKIVNVVYTTNNWATTQTTPANFSALNTTLGTESWWFTMNIGATATAVDFAISYTVNGQTYWDNNYGLNYHRVITR